MPPNVHYVLLLGGSDASGVDAKSRLIPIILFVPVTPVDHDSCNPRFQEYFSHVLALTRK